MVKLNDRRPTQGTDELDQVFLDRRSTRAFSSEPLDQSVIDTLFEAARWAPSAVNSQPWEFIYATDGPERQLFDELVKPGNRRWASSAPLLAFLVTKKHNGEGRVFRTNQFDAGAAWMALALQATRLGLYTHAMGGIEIDQVHEKLGLSPDNYDVMIGIVIGRLGDAADLPEDLQEREIPNGRKPLSEVASRWE